MRIALIVFAPAILAGSALGQVTNLDFEDVARGSLVTNQYLAQGLLVSGINGSSSGFIPGTVLDINQFQDDGVFDFGGSPNQALLYGVVKDTLRFDFVDSNGQGHDINHVSMRIGDGDNAFESFRVTVWGAGDVNLFEQDITTTSGPINGGATFTYDGAGVRAVTVLGIGSGSGGAVDDLSYGIVPSPSAVLLMGVSGGMVGLRRRR